MLQRKDYQDGPHLFREDTTNFALYFERNESKWKMMKREVAFADSIEIGNPYFDSMAITAQEISPLTTSRYDASDRVLVMSDIEGNYESFLQLGMANGVIDQRGSWSYGRDQLVILGDIHDRGPDVTPLLWHLFQLEQEASEAGGQLHVLLGNHEQMAFDGDARYIHEKYKRIAEDTGIRYADLYAPSTILGKWLRSRNTVVAIGNVLYSHAGISPTVAQLGMSLDAINDLLRSHNSGAHVPTDQLVALHVLLGTHGILWSRSWVESPAKESVLDEILSYYGVNQMIVGHTLVPHMHSIYQGKILAIDVNHHGSKQDAQALLFDLSQPFVVDQHGKKSPLAVQ